MAVGFRDPLGDGTITVSRVDADGFYALRVFMKPDIDDGNTLGNRHLGTDWNATSDANELAYASYGGTIAYVNSNAGSSRGGVVMVNHTLPDGSKFTTVYMHLEHIPARILDGTQTTVGRGEFLGDSGFVKTGWGLHVHYEVREGHQTGLTGVGYGYYGGTGQGTLVSSGTSNEVHYADIRNPEGNTVRYLDPLEFTERYRTVTDPVTSRPDLVIRNASVDDTTVNIGQRVTVNWEVRNDGSGSAGSSYAGVYLSRDATWDRSDIKVGGESTSSLTAGGRDTGEAATFTVPESISAGTWNVLVLADDGRLVFESSETNNVWSQRITVSGNNGRPDLVIENVRIDDSTVRPGQTVNVSWDARNTGSAEAVASDQFIYLSTDRILSSNDRYLDHETLGTMTVGERDAENESFTMPNNLARGRYYIAVVADARLDVREINETNNTSWGWFDII